MDHMSYSPYILDTYTLHIYSWTKMITISGANTFPITEAVFQFAHNAYIQPLGSSIVMLEQTRESVTLPYCCMMSATISPYNASASAKISMSKFGTKSDSCWPIARVPMSPITPIAMPEAR